jgi:hypothetical protein
MAWGVIEGREVVGVSARAAGGKLGVRVWDFESGRPGPERAGDVGCLAFATMAEDPLGPVVRSEAEVIAVTPATWPAVYIARVDGFVSLTELTTGADLCPPMLLPRTPRALAVTDDDGLAVAFGNDVAMVYPPLGDTYGKNV